MREILDILGNKIEVGDIVLRPIHSSLTKVYILGISAKGVCISSQKVTRTGLTYYSGQLRPDYTFTDSNAKLENHNSKQYLSYPPDFYILEKNAVIPENLKQFIKY